MGVQYIQAGLVTDLNALIYKGGQLRFGQCADFGRQHITVFKDHQRGYAADAEFGWCSGIFVNI